MVLTTSKYPSRVVPVILGIRNSKDSRGARNFEDSRGSRHSRES